MNNDRLQTQYVSMIHFSRKDAIGQKLIAIINKNFTAEETSCGMLVRREGREAIYISHSHMHASERCASIDVDNCINIELCQ